MEYVARPAEDSTFSRVTIADRLSSLPRSRVATGVVIRWLLGLGWSLFAGHFVVGVVVDGLRAQIRAAPEAFDDSMPSTWEPDPRIPSWAEGLIERLFFTLAVAFDVSGSATAMMAWIAIRMAAHWNRL